MVNAQTGEIAQRMDYDEFGNVLLTVSSYFSYTLRNAVFAQLLHYRFG